MKNGSTAAKPCTQTLLSFVVEKLQDLFEKLQFEVHLMPNLTGRKIIEVLSDIGQNQDHTHFDAFVCCILTHGVSGYVYGQDGQYVRSCDVKYFTRIEFLVLTDSKNNIAIIVC